jgi:hypothetical protein
VSATRGPRTTGTSGRAFYEALLGALDVLYSCVYDVPASTMREAARLRVQAMDLSDRWVEAGCDLADPLLSQERRALVASYTALRDSVERHQPEAADVRVD